METKAESDSTSSCFASVTRDGHVLGFVVIRGLFAETMFDLEALNYGAVRGKSEFGSGCYY